jgi:hypothetical protein
VLQQNQRSRAALQLRLPAWQACCTHGWAASAVASQVGTPGFLSKGFLRFLSINLKKKHKK